MSDSPAKQPRLFYWSADQDAFVPLPESYLSYCLSQMAGLEEVPDGQEFSLRFKRVDLTDEEMAGLLGVLSLLPTAEGVAE